MKNALISILLIGATLLACGEGDVSIGTRASSTTEDAGGPPATPDAAGPSTTPPKTTCSGDDICIDVLPARAGTKPLPGRLVVFWVQLDDDGPDPVWKVAYETAFLGTETRVAIPRAAIAPPDEAHFVCERACEDEATCPCLSEPKVAIGLVGVFHDANVNGKADLADRSSTSEPMLGTGMIGFAHSDKALAPADLGFLAPLFPKGVTAGSNAYRAVPRTDNPTFDGMDAVPAGTVFEIHVCDTTDEAQCDGWDSVPNFT